MPIFIYEAADENGKIVRGKIDGATREEAMSSLQKQNLLPIQLDEHGDVRGAGGLGLILFERIRPIDRIMLARNLAVTLRAGLSIVEAVDVLLKDANRKLLRSFLISAKFSLERGQPLSAIFAAYPQFFPSMFVGLIKAGENSGRLDEALDELAVQLTKEYELARKVKSAFAYPVILLIGSFGVVTLLLTFVLPRLIRVFQISGVKLPMITQVFIYLSNILTYNLWLDLTVIGLIGWFFVYFRKTVFGQHLFLSIFFHFPVVKELIKKVALTRFARTLSGLISSGTNIIDALQLSSEAVGNIYYRQVLLKAIEQIRGGVSLSETMQETPHLFPSLLVSLTGVGEKTGTLDYVLKTFANFYDEEIDSTLKDLTTFLEPILLLFMGLIIGAVALSVLLPIYQLVGSFS